MGSHLYKYVCNHYTHRFKINMNVKQIHAMDAKLVVFQVYKNKQKNLTNTMTTLNQFVQKFYGQDTTTHEGKYKYHRRGLLESIPHIRLIRGVIVVRGVDLGVVVDFLNRYNAELWVWDVTLSLEDEKTLTREP